MWLLILASVDAILVNTTSGAVQGVVSDGVAAFLGIPFAVPPLKELRFESPTPHAGWDVLDATSAKPACVQGSKGDEDCLVLNVFAPVNATKAPVIFLIHGGGFVSGSARADLWTTARDYGVVLAAPQYRLGVFGFLCLDDCVNVGLQDQELALEFFSSNAAAFGGDPSRLVLMGGSAGGASVDHFLLSSSTLYAAVSLESPGGHQGWMTGDVLDNDDWMSERLRRNHSEELGNVTALRALDADDLWAKASPLRLAPSLVDDQGRDDYPIHRIRRGLYNTRVSIIVGGVSCESCSDAQTLLGPPRDNVSALEFRNALASSFPPGSSVTPRDLERWYAPRVATDGRWLTLARILSDSGHACSTALHARAFLQTSQAPVWRYFFGYTNANDPLPGATHGSDETWILGLVQSNLSTTMAAWWTTFARTMDPSPDWPPFDDSRLVMFFGDDHQPSATSGRSLDTLRPECEHWAPFLGWNGEDASAASDDVPQPCLLARTSYALSPSLFFLRLLVTVPPVVFFLGVRILARKPHNPRK